MKDWGNMRENGLGVMMDGNGDVVDGGEKGMK